MFRRKDTLTEYDMAAATMYAAAAIVDVRCKRKEKNPRKKSRAVGLYASGGNRRVGSALAAPPSTQESRRRSVTTRKLSQAVYLYFLSLIFRCTSQISLRQHGR